MDELHPPSTQAPSPDFEILAPAGGGPPFHLPVSVKSLSAGGVILEATYPPDGLDLQGLQGRGGVINLPAAGNGGSMAIRAKIQWARSQGNDNPKFLVGLELEDSSMEVRHALEGQMHIVTKDIKELWDHWDRLQEKVPLVPSPSQAIYIVGMSVVLGGVALQMWGPDDYKSFGFILVIYGCVTLAVKSIWSLWRQRGNPKGQEPMTSNR
jgi:hypothetical protein